MGNMSADPVHVLVLMTAAGPWRLVRGRWTRPFRCDDTGATFVLHGPEVV